MRRLLVLFTCFCFLIPLSVKCLVKVSDYIFVTDQAKVLSNSTINHITQYSKFLYDTEDVDYYVVTVNSLEGIDLDEYVDYVYDSFELSQNGLLIFFAKKERTIKAMAGTKLSNVLDDDTLQEAINLYFMPYFKNDDWDHGIINGYNAFYKMICNYYDIDSTSMLVYNGKDFLNRYKIPILFLLIWIGTMLSYVFCKYFKRIYRKRNLMTDHFIFGITLFVDILILIFSYSIEFSFFLVLLLSELVSIFGFFYGSNISTEKKKISSKKRRKKKVSKK